jgi:hypothetical protein
MEIKFEDKYVAFIDVLGFTALVDSNNTDRLQIYFDAMEVAFNIFTEDKRNLKKFIISDSIIFIANDTEEDFKTLLKAIRNLQAFLAMNDIWVRGGIAFGPVFYEDTAHIIVGKAFIKAYLLEKEAKYPRVIIDPSILTKLNINLRTFYEEYNGFPHQRHDDSKLIHDYGFYGYKRFTPDDAIFVCYAHRVFNIAEQEGKKYKNTQLKVVYNHLKGNLYGPQQHYHKYLWVKKYFHESLQELYDNSTGSSKRRNWLEEPIRDFSSL